MYSIVCIITSFLGAKFVQQYFVCQLQLFSIHGFLCTVVVAKWFVWLHCGLKQSALNTYIYILCGRLSCSETHLEKRSMISGKDGSPNG